MPAKTTTTAKKPAAKTAAKKPAAKTAAKASAKKAPVKAEAKAPAKKPELPAKFTLTTMSAYLADSRGMSRKDAREVLDSVFELVEAGVMQGNRVPMGNMGKVFVKVKPATKARMGRNPLTGESIKIAAKKATKVPRFTFGKAFKETVLKAKVKE
ncbi:MAG TPA: HU family DNA-binding protein [Spirochaetales bacterium]|nr:HU family DNA-binding protein [Spirochaetales bacterium]